MERTAQRPPQAVSAMVIALAVTSLGLGACGTRVSGRPGALPTGGQQQPQGQPEHPLLGGTHQAPASIDTVQSGAESAVAPARSKGTAGAAPTEVAAAERRMAAFNASAATLPAAGRGEAPNRVTTLAPDGPPAPSPTSPLPAGPASPVLLASVGTLSGPAGNVLITNVRGAQLWVAWVNSRGGVNGHQIRVLIYDDGGDPARHKSQVQDAVERRGVKGFFMNVEALTGEPTLEYIHQKRMPVIGTETAEPWAFRSPLYFVQASNDVALSYTVINMVANEIIPRGKRKLATIVCAEVQICTNADNLFAEKAKQLGLDPVYRAKSTLTQPDYTAECLAASSAGAEAFIVYLDSNSLRRIAASCARQNYRPIFASVSSVGVDDMKADSNLDGLLVSSNVFPFFQNDTPATAEFHAAFAAFGKGMVPSVGIAAGWTAGKLLERVLANIAEPPRTVDLLQGLWSIKQDDLGGLTFPLTFEENKPASPTACWFTIKVQSGQWVSPDGNTRHCVPFSI
jgi:ABC-type branched-subunit amino acid transport system substrate-binding protein